VPGESIEAIRYPVVWRIYEGWAMRFSERHGFIPVRSVIQLESVDDALRNSLWSLIKLYIWDNMYRSQYGSVFDANPRIRELCRKFWFNYYKIPLDLLGNDWQQIYKFLRDDFFNCEWFKMYDFLEFVIDNYPYDDRDNFTQACNHSLEIEMSGYRIIDRNIAPITSEEEVAEIETAIDNGIGAVRTHLRRALELLADKKSPDYRNSIKESISSVESLVQDVLGQKGTLGKLVKKLESEIGLHPALGKAFDNLYGYTSDEDGIRHSIMDSATVDFEDAKFFLVVCSAFANFVSSKVKK
jgi:hypothetical protein